jgi:lysozyme
VQPAAKRVIGSGLAAALAIASVMAAKYEGRRLHAYQDTGGVWTLCDGHTRGVKEGDSATPEQCDEWRKEDLLIANNGIDSCVHAPLNVNQRAALLSFFYNVGAPKACASTLVRKANAFLPGSEWCPELLRWTHAGGTQLPGLVKRRRAEMALCLRPDFSNVVAG